MRRILLGFVVAVLMAVGLLAQGPLTPIGQLMGRTDGNGALMAKAGVFTGSQGPLTPIAQLRGRTDSSGNLLVALAASGTTSSAIFLAGDGLVGAPSYSWTSEPTSGWWRNGAGDLMFSVLGVATQRQLATGTVLCANCALSWGSAGVTGGDTVLARDAANTVAQKNLTNAQSMRWYFTATGPVYTSLTARTAGSVLTAVGGAMQLSTAQTTVPTCSANCGTSPAVVGTDTAGIVTMGSTGVPASGWVVTFNGTWPAAPSCNVIPALAGMVAGKAPIVVATSTTTITVTTNGTAPATSDKYAYQCIGVS